MDQVRKYLGQANTQKVMLEQRALHLKDKVKKTDDENKDLRVANVKGKMQTMDLEEMGKLNEDIDKLKMDETNFK